jgi:hypothetical protein
MKYGEDCCIGNFVDGVWVDSPKGKGDKGLLPKLEPFLWPTDGADCWELLEDFSIRIRDKIFTVKKGFWYDGASIPRMFWVTIGHPLGVRKIPAATVHDVLYSTNALPQTECDEIFLELLEAFEESWACRNKCFVAVRIGGRFVYPKKQKELDLYKDFIVITQLPKKEEILEPLLS